MPFFVLISKPAYLLIVLAKLPQEDGEAVGIEAGQLQPEGLPRAGLHCGREPVILVQGRNDLNRLHARAREPTADGQVQTQAAFILTEDPYGSVGFLPP
jgi:hypothetical protein